MNTTSESTVGAIIGGSDRQHEAAAPNSKRHRPRTALQKLLSLVEPIMRPLNTDIHETSPEKDEAGRIPSVEDILSCAGQRNSFEQFLRASAGSASFLKEFHFLCLVREFREWADLPSQYGPCRLRVLSNYITHNFVREGAPAALTLPEPLRRRVERAQECKVPSAALFNEAYAVVSALLVQERVLRAFADSHYSQTMWEGEDMDCSLFRALSLGGNNLPRLRGGSLGSSASSRSNFFDEGRSCELSSSDDVSAIQSIASSKSGSSKSSTGSNASSAFDKYYSSKNSNKRNSKKKGIVSPVKLMEELLPRLEIIAQEQNVRVQSFGNIGSGPHGGDTPVAVRNRTVLANEGSAPVDTSALGHASWRALPHLASSGPSHSDMSTESLPSHPAPQLPTLPAPQLPTLPAPQLPTIPVQLLPTVPLPPAQLPTMSVSQPHLPPQQHHSNLLSQPTALPHPPPNLEVQVAYSFSTDPALCYGKVLPGPSCSLAQFKDIISWRHCPPNTRFFFKKQIPGIGELHEEIASDDAPVPFWSQNTVLARVEIPT